MTYRIVAWKRVFEDFRARAARHCRYLCLPLHRGLGAARIIRESDGRSIYGIFVLLAVYVASKSSDRDGWLTKDGLKTGLALTVQDMADWTGATNAEMERALAVLTSPQVGWIEPISTPTGASTLLLCSSTILARNAEEVSPPLILSTELPTGARGYVHSTATQREGGTSEGVKVNTVLQSVASAAQTTAPTPPGTLLEDEIVQPFPIRSGKDWYLTRSAYERLAAAYPGLNLPQELVKAAAWLDANPSRRKTARGMPRFLSGWLNRAGEA